jgi:MoxR-like ATPase
MGALAEPAATPAGLKESLAQAGYVADESLASAVWLSRALDRPLLLEGDAGVGKTALALAVAKASGATLVRLQCFDGLDLAQASYEWNYGRQLLAIRLGEAEGSTVHAQDLFTRDYLLERPLLKALSQDGPCVLLIDEVDRADEAFEAYLLEVLAEYQLTIPELGTVKARYVPQVFLTSNGTRDLSDALRRRCLYHWLDYPSLEREIAIVRSQVPEADGRLVADAVQFLQRLRRQDLVKTPGVAETLDWIRALHQLHHSTLPDDMLSLLSTLGCLLKTREDRFKVGVEELSALRAGEPLRGVAEGARGASA